MPSKLPYTVEKTYTFKGQPYPTEQAALQAAVEQVVDLGEATRKKFNEVSRRVRANVFIAKHDTILVIDPGQMELDFERPL